MHVSLCVSLKYLNVHIYSVQEPGTDQITNLSFENLVLKLKDCEMF